LVFFAIAVGRDEDATRWALKAVEAGRGGWKEEISGGLRLYAVCQAILEDRYADALDMAVDASVGLATEYSTSAGGQEPLESSASPAPMMGGHRDQATRARGEYGAATVALIPIIFRLATLWMSDAESSREAALGLADDCRRIAKTAEAPEVWNEAARMLNEVFSKDASWQQLNEQGNEYAAKNETVLYIICYAGAMLHVRPSDALRIQLRILPVVYTQMKHFGIFRRIAIPFVITYWRVTLDRAPHFFRMPVLLKEKVDKLVADPSESGLKSLLRELAFPLDVTLTDSDREWLKFPDGQKLSK